MTAVKRGSVKTEQKFTTKLFLQDLGVDGWGTV